MVWGLGFSVRGHAFVFRIYGLGPREEAEGAGGFEQAERLEDECLKVICPVIWGLSVGSGIWELRFRVWVLGLQVEGLVQGRV